MIFTISIYIICNISILNLSEIFDKLYVETEKYIWSHNDYEKQVNPLFDALELGVQMIEADVHLIEGKLYVSHDYPTDLINTPELENMYLEPLLERIKVNNGKVLPNSSLQFYLVIDVKSEAEATYKVLQKLLLLYLPILNRMENGVWIDGPVRLLVSGNRPKLDRNAMNRNVFIDGRIDNLGSGYSTDYFPIISDYWFKYFTWDGNGIIPEHELAILREIVARTHEEDKMIRFWGTPDKEEVWNILFNEDVDIINADKLEAVSNYIKNR